MVAVASPDEHPQTNRLNSQSARPFRVGPSMTGPAAPAAILPSCPGAGAHPKHLTVKSPGVASRGMLRSILRDEPQRMRRPGVEPGLLARAAEPLHRSAETGQSAGSVSPASVEAVDRKLNAPRQDPAQLGSSRRG